MPTPEKADTSTSQHTAGLYIRLSREDGDRSESLSVINQRLLLQEFVQKQTDFSDYEFYIDDGFTGTNFNRPAFQRMLQDIENGKIHCVIVKDLSRLGRNMAKVSIYIQEYFPKKKVRFIAIDDNIDRQFFNLDTSEDMMIDLKNMFNGFYPKDISKKVRSTFRSKQRDGQFIGAFACYGYKKSPADHNQLVIDEPAANIVRRIFQLYLDGYGQNTIAKMLNHEKIPCPSEYKKRCGLHYCNGNRLENTTYWTYSSVRNILRHRIYTGTMVQNCSFRQPCSNTAVRMPESEWIIVPDTHEAIIPKEIFDRVQDLLKLGTKQTKLEQSIHIFAGLLRCGDCGRAMVKITRKGTDTFRCGSYHRYGTGHCSAHTIDKALLEEIVLADLNSIVQSIHPLKEIILAEEKKRAKRDRQNAAAQENLQKEIRKLLHKKEHAYNDYVEGILSKKEYIKYKEQCNVQISFLKEQSNQTAAPEESKESYNTWITELLKTGYIKQLDRATVVEMIHRIYIYDNQTIKIVYHFSDELESLSNVTKNAFS